LNPQMPISAPASLMTVRPAESMNSLPANVYRDLQPLATLDH